MSATVRRPRAALARARRIAGRLRSDGRLPPATMRLLRGFIAAETVHRTRRAVARSLLTAQRAVGVAGARHVVTGQWWPRVVGPDLDVPFVELAHRHADVVRARLHDIGLEPFLVDVEPAGPVHLGLPAADRRRAATALGVLDPAEAWYVETHRGGRRRTGLAGSRRVRRAAGRAESWHVHRLHRHGDHAVGRESAVQLSFWAPGADGRVERLGVRGLHRFEPTAEPTVERIAGRDYAGSTAFPVERSARRFRSPVDVVITWVDGDDPDWRADMAAWRARGSGGPPDPQATDGARFTSHDELRYVLRSLWTHAGWVRHIHLVTAGQRPAWLRTDDQLRVVDHRDIFPDDWLPTFNSHAIEARLHHIDDLAEHFLYLNDDMFLGRPTGPDTYFTPNGLSKFFESEARVPVRSAVGRDRSVDTAARRGRDLLEDEFGVLVTHKLEHAPYALRRSVLQEIEQRFADDVQATARHRFRDPGDVSIPSAFAHHYALVTGRAVPGQLTVAYENLGGRRLGPALRRLELARDVDAICINETEHWETDPASAERRLAAFLQAYFPVPSPWETDAAPA